MERVVDRSEFLSDASPPPPSPDITQLKGLERFEFIEQQVERVDGEEGGEEDELEFCLFAPSTAGKPQDGKQVSKIRLESPPPNSTPSFLNPSRDKRYYFTESLTSDERQNFEAAAISGRDVLAQAHIRWPGSSYAWRVMHVKPTKKQLRALAASDALYATLVGETEPSKRKRPGKQSRLKLRAKKAAVNAQQEEARKAAELKEAADREKRTRRNREKKLKKRSREKAKKAGAVEGSDGEESQPG